MEQGYGVVRLAGCTVLINWQRSANTCHGSKMIVRVLPAPITTPAEQRAGKYFLEGSEKSNVVYRRDYVVDRDPHLGVCWEHANELHSSEKVATAALEALVKAAARDAGR